MKQSEYPANGRDFEARAFSDYATSPNIRRAPADYPINDDNSPIKVVNFNAVGGSTIMYTAHYPRLHPSDFRTRTLDDVGDDWPIDYATLEPFYAENDRMMGVAGLAGDPAYPRFFALIGLFVTSMTGLVLSNNYLLTYVFWEGVGVCSYLLVGFWHTRPKAAAIVPSDITARSCRFGR